MYVCMYVSLAVAPKQDGR